ncbi:MAG: ribonuclease P protein component [Bacteroidetes bacterium GWF2_40_14]|nr:MAG: ribonuclease P protein component [Bacteroidetes bacterium GWF2_40_14]
MSTRFPKEEKLTSIIRIQEIFDKGTVLFIHPIKIYYLSNDCTYNRVLITVPKRLHKKAVSRNLLKRRIREAYRLNKGVQQIHIPAPTFVDINIVYISGDIMEFKPLNNKISNALAKMQKNINMAAKPNDAPAKRT